MSLLRNELVNLKVLPDFFLPLNSLDSLFLFVYGIPLFIGMVYRSLQEVWVLGSEDLLMALKKRYLEEELSGREFVILVFGETVCQGLVTLHLNSGLTSEYKCRTANYKKCERR